MRGSGGSQCHESHLRHTWTFIPVRQMHKSVFVFITSQQWCSGLSILSVSLLTDSLIQIKYIIICLEKIYIHLIIFSSFISTLLYCIWTLVQSVCSTATKCKKMQDMERKHLYHMELQMVVKFSLILKWTKKNYLHLLPAENLIPWWVIQSEQNQTSKQMKNLGLSCTSSFWMPLVIIQNTQKWCRK